MTCQQENTSFTKQTTTTSAVQLIATPVPKTGYLIIPGAARRIPFPNMSCTKRPTVRTSGLQ